MRFPTFTLSLCALAIASCGSAQSGDSIAKPTPATDAPFKVQALGTFDEAWAISIEPGTGNLFITEKGGTMKFVQPANGRTGTVTGIPQVAYAGQGGLADFIFAPDYAKSHAIYLSWAEAGEGGNKGGAVGRGTLVCEEHDSCRIDGLKVIWRQQPKVPGVLQYALRMTFSPDGKYLFVSSGERQKMDPAQAFDGNLGKVLHLDAEGRPVARGPFAARGGVAMQFYSMGHRNILGLAFAPDGRLWETEMGPKGGDELNLIQPGRNYGWPVASNGSHYDGRPIPDHGPGDHFEPPKVWWNPSISPGGLLIYSGDRFKGWKGDALVPALSGKALIRVDIKGDTATKAEQWAMDERIRAVDQGPNGSVYLIEDGEDGAGGRLLRLDPVRK